MQAPGGAVPPQFALLKLSLAFVFRIDSR